MSEEICLPSLGGTLYIRKENVLHYGVFDDTRLVDRGGTVVVASGPPIAGPVTLHEVPADEDGGPLWLVSCELCGGDEQIDGAYARDEVLPFAREWSVRHRCPT